MSDRESTSRRAEPVLSELELYSEYRNSDRWAIIVGISRYRYQGWNLKYAERDATELYDLLLTPNGGGFKKECICKLVNEEATTSKMTQALRSFLKKPSREDLVLIYFACHGTPDFDRPGNVYLLTHDTNPGDVAGTALPMREIDLALRENLLAEKVIVLADTCHSGAIGGGIGRRNAVDDSTLVNLYLQEVSRAKGGIALLTSAEANEVSFEDKKWGGGHGVFTYYLLQGMRGEGDRDGNGIVTVGELFEYVRDNVKLETNYRQHPSIGTNAYDRNLPIAINPNATFSTIHNVNLKEDINPLHPISKLTKQKQEAEEIKRKITSVPVNKKNRKLLGIMFAILGGISSIIYAYNNNLITSHANSKSPSPQTPENAPHQRNDNLKIINKEKNIKALNTYKISIHFLDSNTDFRKEGELIKQIIIGYGLPESQIQVRGLPQSWFDSAGGLSSNQIRYERGVEDRAAKALKDVLAEIYPTRNFDLQTIRGSTPNAISIFLK